MADEFARRLRKVQANRRTSGLDDVSTGLQIGQQVGKLIGGLAGAIHGSQQDAAANKLMNTQDAPRAALVDAGTGNAPVDTTPQDLGSLPSDTGGSDVDLGQAMTASRLSDSGPNVGDAPAANAIPAGVSTAGTKPFTGGVAGMKLQQEFQKNKMADQLSALKLAGAQRDAANAQAEDAGTGRYALDAQIKRAQLAKIQSDINAKNTPKPAKVDKNPPAVDIDSEPVIDQNQLTNHIDGIYGKGSTGNISRTLMEPDTIDDPKNPGTQIPNPNAPAYTKDDNGVVSSVTVGPKSKRVSMPINEAQTYVKQANALRIKQNLPAYRVPGEPQDVGASADKPYIAKNNLDVYSRAPGTWITLPNGKVAQVPQRRRQQ